YTGGGGAAKPAGYWSWPQTQRQAYDKGIAQAQAKQDVAATERNRQMADTAGIVTEDVDRAINMIDTGKLPTTGIAGRAYGAISPQSPAGTLAAALNTIKANLTI